MYKYNDQVKQMANASAKETKLTAQNDPRKIRPMAQYHGWCTYQNFNHSLDALKRSGDIPWVQMYHTVYISCISISFPSNWISSKNYEHIHILPSIEHVPLAPRSRSSLFQLQGVISVSKETKRSPSRYTVESLFSRGALNSSSVLKYPLIVGASSSSWWNYH